MAVASPGNRDFTELIEDSTYRYEFVFNQAQSKEHKNETHAMQLDTTRLPGAALAVLAATAQAGEIINTDFSKGTFQELGWKAEGKFDVFKYETSQNNPGAVARMPARSGKGTLTKTFTEVKQPAKLELSLDWAGAGGRQARRPMAPSSCYWTWAATATSSTSAGPMPSGRCSGAW